MNEQPFRIFIVEDHPLVRQGLQLLIVQHPGLTVCGEVDNASEALRRIESAKPDLAIVDLSLPDESGIELIKTLKAAYPRLLIIVLSMHDERVYAERAIRAGARGFIMKRETSHRIIEGIQKVRNGGLAISGAVSEIFVEKYGSGLPPPGPSIEQLSDRELQVFQLLGSGIGTPAIARKLHISLKTVQAHCANIKEKLDLANATELLREAMRWHEADPH